MDGGTAGAGTDSLTGNPEHGHDVGARRAEIVARLLDRGLTVRVLHALLPGWEETIRTAHPATDGPDGA